MIESSYRLAKKGSIDLPVQVRSSGYYRVWCNWRDLAIRKFFLELFWCISGSGTFTDNTGNSRLLSAGQCCCYFPGDCHRICANDKFEFCWITFDGAKTEQLIEQFSLTREPWDAGECPQELFAELRSRIKKPGTEGELLSSVIGYEILARSKTPLLQHDTTLTEQFIDIVDNEFDDPFLCIETIAERLGIHRSTLVRNIYAICRKSPKEYITEYRMQQALSLIHGTTLSIKEIAGRTGFSSPNYFGKVFMRFFGKTPGEMRKAM